MPAPDAVYLIRHREHNEELRFSLRSLVYVPHGTVWLVGYQPTWTQNVGHIQTHEQHGPKWINLTTAIATACASPDISDEFYLFDDDHFVMEPMASIPVLHRGPIADIKPYYGEHYQGVRETEGYMRDLGLEGELLSYELHVPLPVAKARMAEILPLPSGSRPACLHQRTLYGNYFRIGGEQVADVKVFGPRFTPAGSPFLSTAPGVFASGAAGEYIRNRFREPSPYER